jgi:2'-5' RNA ligase
VSDGAATRAKSGIFILAPIHGPTGERIAEVQSEYDPKLARLGPPHVTLAGSSGMGPILARTPVEELEEHLGPIAERTAPIEIHFGAPTRFMQTEIIVLPLDPHGPLRALHEAIKTSGLRATAPRFYFTPHVTLSLYREQPREVIRALLAMRFDEPATIDTIECHLTKDTGESRKLLTLELNGN